MVRNAEPLCARENKMRRPASAPRSRAPTPRTPPESTVRIFFTLFFLVVLLRNLDGARARATREPLERPVSHQRDPSPRRPRPSRLSHSNQFDKDSFDVNLCALSGSVPLSQPLTTSTLYFCKVSASSTTRAGIYDRGFSHVQFESVYVDRVYEALVKSVCTMERVFWRAIL